VSEHNELESFLENALIKIKVFGSGGAGNNTLDTLYASQVRGAQLIALNTDAQDLLSTTADRKVLLGRNLTRGLGAGNNPVTGENAAREAQTAIREEIEETDLAFIVGGLGGGTGTGSLPVIAEILREQGILTVAVVSLPFKMEGQRRWANAMLGLRKLEGMVDALIVLPNEKLMAIAPNMPLQQAFKMADNVSAEALKGIIELITKPGIVNLDFSDVKAILKDSGVAVIGVGESDTQQRAIEAVQMALNNPLVEANLQAASGALINVIGGMDMTLSQAQSTIEEVKKALAEDAKIIWGTQLEEDMKGKVKVLVVITGLTSKAMVDSQAKDGYVTVDDLL
jgi:cell division protein FtsZ